MNIAVIGYKGFVGRALFDALQQAGHNVTGVDRSSYDEHQLLRHDILINAAMPAKRFWALNHPKDDFNATVTLTADLLYNWQWQKYIQISSVSARTQLDHPYGIHKATAELLVRHHSKPTLIIRLGGLFGPGLDKGALLDILQEKTVFVSGQSRYNYIATPKAAAIIVRRMHETGCIDVGAKDQISLQEIADHCGKTVQWKDKMESQNTESPQDDYPDAKEVLTFLEEKNA